MTDMLRHELVLQRTAAIRHHRRILNNRVWLEHVQEHKHSREILLVEAEAAAIGAEMKRRKGTLS